MRDNALGLSKRPHEMLKSLEYKYIVVIIYASILFLDRLDLTIVNITLPTLAQYFHVSITQTEWITNSFLLALAIIIPASGWLGDKFGSKKIFIIATAVFGISSLLCAFAPNFLFMVAMRFLQGLSGGVIIPVGMTMVYRGFAPAEYASVTSFIFIPSLIAPAIAPALGGLITHYFGWQWVFIFAVPICFVAVILSIIILHEEKAVDIPALDWRGFFFSSAALVLLLYSISVFGKHGFDFISLIFLLATLLFVYLFIRQENNTQYPLIDLRFFKNKLFLQANFTQLTFQICHFGAIFLVSMYLQVGIGMSAMVSGLIMGMQALGAICVNRYSVKLFNRVGPSVPIIIGFIGIAVFSLGILLITNPQMMKWGLLILFLRGIFSGLCGTPIQTISVLDFAKKDLGQINTIFNASRQVSISLGVAISSLLIAYGFKANEMHPDQAITTAMAYPIFHYGFFLLPIVALIGIIVALTIDNQRILAILRTS